MSNYRYESYGVIRDLKSDIPYHTDDIVDLLEGKDKHIKELEEENKECKHWENMFHKLSTEEDNAITKVNKSLSNPMTLIDDYNKWADYTIEQIKQSQKQLAIKELEELQKEFDYCPYSGDSIYVAEVYDKIFAKIQELGGGENVKN